MKKLVMCLLGNPIIEATGKSSKNIMKPQVNTDEYRTCHAVLNLFQGTSASLNNELELEIRKQVRNDKSINSWLDMLNPVCSPDRFISASLN